MSVSFNSQLQSEVVNEKNQKVQRKKFRCKMFVAITVGVTFETDFSLKKYDRKCSPCSNIDICHIVTLSFFPLL